MIAIDKSKQFLQTTQFIRCIKPNNQELPKKIDDALVLQQLKAANIIAYAQLMQLGYPVRVSLDVLNNKYEPYFTNATFKQFYAKLLSSLGFKFSDFKFGEKLIFFRDLNYEPIDRLLGSPPECILKMRRYIARIRFRSIIFLLIFLKR